MGGRSRTEGSITRPALAADAGDDLWVDRQEVTALGLPWSLARLRGSSR